MSDWTAYRTVTGQMTTDRRAGKGDLKVISVGRPWDFDTLRLSLDRRMCIALLKACDIDVKAASHRSLSNQGDGHYQKTKGGLVFLEHAIYFQPMFHNIHSPMPILYWSGVNGFFYRKEMIHNLHCFWMFKKTAHSYPEDTSARSSSHASFIVYVSLESITFSRKTFYISLLPGKHVEVLVYSTLPREDGRNTQACKSNAVLREMPQFQVVFHIHPTDNVEPKRAGEQVNYLKIDMRVHFEAYELLPITANNALDFKTVFKTFQAQRSCRSCMPPSQLRAFGYQVRVGWPHAKERAMILLSFSIAFQKGDGQIDSFASVFIFILILQPSISTSLSKAYSVDRPAVCG
ncbi:hypothetical protein LguiA_036049 [Lonicera macranthoides]